MDKDLLKRYGLHLDSLVSDILAVETEPSPRDATDIYSLLHVHSHGFAFADASAHQAALRCIQWGAGHSPPRLSEITFRSLPAVIDTTSISESAKILEMEQKGFLAVHNGEDWIGTVEPSAIKDAERYNLGHAAISLIAGEAPLLIDIDAPITLARELIRRSTASVLIVMDQGKTVGYVDANSLLHRLRPQDLPAQWEQSLGAYKPLAKALAETAERCGNQLYLVGGAVRDILMGTEINDLDCSIVGDTAAFAKHLKEDFGGEVSHEPTFGAVHWTTDDGLTADLTMVRVEQYPDREDLPVVHASHLIHDLRRRDFTVNAMAIALHASQWGMLIDAFGGYADLKSHTVRILHGLSFIHDPTRMLRAARYVSRFGLSMAPRTLQSLHHALEHNAGRRLSKERLGNELSQVFCETNPITALELLLDWGCLSRWLPEIAAIPNLLSQASHATNYSQLHGDDVSLAIWLVLSKNVSAGTRQRLERMTSTQKRSHHVWTQLGSRCAAIVEQLSKAVQCAEHERPSLWGAALQKSSPPIWACLHCDFPEAIDWWRSTGKDITLAIDGGMLLDAGIPKGPQIGAALRRAWAVAWSGGDQAAQRQAAMNG
ncbi:MAG: hypothetical protein VX026_00450 [Myxococcota bacterium]|nr:hypothetical protein [Myxococcota bacterium]